MTKKEQCNLVEKIHGQLLAGKYDFKDKQENSVLLVSEHSQIIYLWTLSFTPKIRTLFFKNPKKALMFFKYFLDKEFDLSDKLIGWKLSVSHEEINL